MHPNSDPISELERGAVIASVCAPRKPAFHSPSVGFQLMVFTLVSTLLGIALVAYLLDSIMSGTDADFGLLMLAIVLFVPAILAVGFVVSPRTRDSIFELREGGVLVSPNMFIVWREIASVNFEGHLPPVNAQDATSLSAQGAPLKLRLTKNSITGSDMALGFVLRDFDAVTMRGPSEETRKLVEPYGDTPGQSVVSFDSQMTTEDYAKLLDITRMLMYQRGFPFRPHTTATEKLQRDEYRVGRNRSA